MDELPCPHALAVLTIKHAGYEKYCSAYYTRKNLLLTYQFQMDPLPNESTWNTPTHVFEMLYFHLMERDLREGQKIKDILN